MNKFEYEPSAITNKCNCNDSIYTTGKDCECNDIGEGSDWWRWIPGTPLTVNDDLLYHLTSHRHCQFITKTNWFGWSKLWCTVHNSYECGKSLPPY